MGNGMSEEYREKGSLAAENAAYLEALVERLMSDDETLAEIDLSNRFIGDIGITTHHALLARNTHVTTLNLSYNQLTARSVPLLLAAVKQCPQLRVLNLSGNPIGDASCAILGTFLVDNLPLEELILFHCNLYDADIVPIINALLVNEHLCVLNLDRNNFTNAAYVMLHQAIVANPNEVLVQVPVGLAKGVVPSTNLVDEINDRLAMNLVSYERKKRNKAILARKMQLRLEKELQRTREKEVAAAAQHAAEEVAAAEAERQQALEADELRQYEEQLAKQRRTKKTPEEIAAENEEWAARAVERAYEWRNKLTANGTHIKEWRDGFTTLTTVPGAALGTVPTLRLEAPRRLQACWCDPNDVSVPYAKTLHYHCKHEDLSRDLKDGQVPHYDGCKASGHICASVGFYTKPKPDMSAAHFFSSPPREIRNENQEIY